MATERSRGEQAFYSTGHFPGGLEPLEAGFESPGPLRVPLSLSPGPKGYLKQAPGRFKRARRREGEGREKTIREGEEKEKERK